MKPWTGVCEGLCWSVHPAAVVISVLKWLWQAAVTTALKP
jgi:hypothetical protein